MSSEKRFDISFKKHYLKPKYWGSWAGILFLGVLAFIPARVRDFFADVLCFLLWRINHKMKKNVLINLTMAYPDMSEDDKLRIYRDFLRVGLKVILGYGESFYRSGEWLKKRYLCTGREYFDEAVATGRPIVFMAPHAWAIDRCGLYLSANGLKMCTMMHTSKNEVYDWFMAVGNLEWLRAQRDTLLSQLRLICGSISEDGSEKLQGFRYLDWPSGGNPAAVHAGLQGLMILAVRCAEKLFEYLGEAEAQDRCRGAENLLRRHTPALSGYKQADALLALGGLAAANEESDHVADDQRDGERHDGMGRAFASAERASAGGAGFGCE